MSYTGVGAGESALFSFAVAMRPRQWLKNALVLAAPLAAGVVGDPDVLAHAAVAFAAFCLASSAVYLANDAADIEFDRLHPTKRHRPVAAGLISVRHACAGSVALAVAGLAVAGFAGSRFVLVLGAYLLIQAGYVLGLKHQAVMDICVVASGFLLRAIGGGVAADLPLSQWFLLVAGFGSLFIVAGKRYSELKALGSNAGTRETLQVYSDSYLRFIWGVSAGATIMSYSLWALGDGSAQQVSWHAISIAPFVVGMLRYAVEIDAGRAGDPEEIVWSDRPLQVLGVAWLLLTSAAVLSGR